MSSYGGQGFRSFRYNRSQAARAIQRRVRGRQARQRRYYKNNRKSFQQAAQLYRQGKTLAYLQNKIRKDGMDYFNFYNETSLAIPKITDPNSLGRGYTIQRMVETASWLPCLDIPSEEQTSSGQWNLLSSKCQMRIELDTETRVPIKFTVYHIKIKPDVYDLAIRNWGRDLHGFFQPTIADSGTPIDAQPNPIFVNATGHVWINKSYFKILSVQSFNLGSRQYTDPDPPETPNPTTNLGDSYKEIYLKQHYGKNGAKLYRGRPDVLEALDDSSATFNRNAQSYILIVSNDSNVGEYNASVTMSMLHTLSTK